MSDTPFHMTVMGRRFFEATMPALVEVLEQINRNLDRLAAKGDQPSPAPRAEQEQRPTPN